MPTKKTTAVSPPPPLMLLMNLGKAQELLRAQAERGAKLHEAVINSKDDYRTADAQLDKWREYTRDLLKQIFNQGTLGEEFFHAGSPSVIFGSGTLGEDIDDYHRYLQYSLDKLDSIIDRAALYPVSGDAIIGATDPTETIEMIARRFPLVVRQLRQRYSDRNTLDVQDEYDVQDLLHSLLRLFFDDIRPEEATPSYAGGAARMDFLLKAEQTVLEAKRTRRGLTGREIANQLIEDVARYQAHPDCRCLICYVYDPDGYIVNPDGIERDLSHTVNGLVVKVFISPKGH